jgi:hypothetical protein
MALQKPITDRVLESLKTAPEYEFESLVVNNPQFTWNELFAEVNRLSRAGRLIITRGVGTFTLKLIVA